MLRTLGVTGLVLSLAGCAAGQAFTRSSPLVGKPLVVRAADLGGTVHDLEEARGKVRVVDFWATWCDPCREQLPFLGRLAEAHAAEGLAVYAVAFDEEREAVERFLAQTPLSFPVLWDRGGNGLAGPLEVTRLPTTVLVDRRGVVREVHVGYEKRDERPLEASVARLLAE